MFTFRCTKRVLDRFHLRPSKRVPEPNNVLGNWYANLLNFGPKRYVLCMSERSLLPVILPARNSEFPDGFGEYLYPILLCVGIPDVQAAREADASAMIWIARTASRSILGAMNDLSYVVRLYLRMEPPFETCLRLAGMPSGPLGNNTPDRLTRQLFEEAVDAGASDSQGKGRAN